MTERIPITVVARNEARALGACLHSLLAACRYAESRMDVRVEPLVVLDSCTDETGRIAQSHGVSTLESSGGKVAGQRRGFRDGAFQIFCDADVLLSEDAIEGLCEAMADTSVLIASPPRFPLPPKRRTPLARALYVYNSRRGFSSQRTWFNGKLFALRGLKYPDEREVMQRASRVSASRFYVPEAGLRADDILLSRLALMKGGSLAIREAQKGAVYFRAPETLRGMYRYYRRLRVELSRTDLLFPETKHVHQMYGSREPDLLASATFKERAAYRLFRANLSLCRVWFELERVYFERLAQKPLSWWPAIEETKQL